MATVDFLQKALDLTREAIENDTNGKYKEAYDLYTKGLDYYMLAIKCMYGWWLLLIYFMYTNASYLTTWIDEKNDKKKELIKTKCYEYLDRAEQLKNHLNKLEKKTETSEASANGSTKAKYAVIYFATKYIHICFI